MRKKIVIGLFSGLVLLQIASPLYMIVKRELVLRNGASFRFKTAPIDPYDAFRGRYVSLKVEAEKADRPKDVILKRGQKVYAQIVVDETGYAKISKITVQKPKDLDFLAANVHYSSDDKVFINLPIERYYMNEAAAPRAERVYREFSGRNKNDAYVMVRIKDGFAVVEGLYIGGRKIEEVLKK